MASELHPLRFELQIWLSLTVGTLTNSRSFKLEILQKPDIQMWAFLTWDFFFLMLLFLSKKNLNLLYIQEHCIRKLGKIRSELKLLFGVYY